MFVNLSRRSQPLVERQIPLIDDLEQGEEDPERLSNLFQMDHLATRMRRNSENLLVLAGHELSRRWNQPVALIDVLRAAVSEIEQYERVSMNIQDGIAVRGQAVNDAVHLLAELAENATSFSVAETPVTVAGHLLSGGGVLLDISDQGIGMGAEEMAHANWRLDNLPVVDVAVSRRMGLFVVARLAARHGIRVRLRSASAGGLTSLVWLPDETVTHEDGNSPGLRRSDLNTLDDAAAGRRSRRGRVRHRSARASQFRRQRICARANWATASVQRRPTRSPPPGRQGSRRCAPTLMTRAPCARAGCLVPGPGLALRLARRCRSAPVRRRRTTRVPRRSRSTRPQLPTVVWRQQQVRGHRSGTARICLPRVRTSRRERACSPPDPACSRPARTVPGLPSSLLPRSPRRWSPSRPRPRGRAPRARSC